MASSCAKNIEDKTGLPFYDERCDLCQLSGKFVCSGEAHFSEMVRLPGLSILGWQNRQIIDPNNPTEAEAEMQNIINADWTADDILTMDHAFTEEIYPSDTKFQEIRVVEALRSISN